MSFEQKLNQSPPTGYVAPLTLEARGPAPFLQTKRQGPVSKTHKAWPDLLTLEVTVVPLADTPLSVEYLDQERSLGVVSLSPVAPPWVGFDGVQLSPTGFGRYVIQGEGHFFVKDAPGGLDITYGNPFFEHRFHKPCPHLVVKRLAMVKAGEVMIEPATTPNTHILFQAGALITPDLDPNKIQPVFLNIIPLAGATSYKIYSLSDLQKRGAQPPLSFVEGPYTYAFEEGPPGSMMSLAGLIQGGHVHLMVQGKPYHSISFTKPEGAASILSIHFKPTEEPHA